jgi:hypothetical protein
MDNLLDFEPVSEIICKLRVKLKYYNLSLTSTHTPNKKKINLPNTNFIDLWTRYFI